VYVLVIVERLTLGAEYGIQPPEPVEAAAEPVEETGVVVVIVGVAVMVPACGAGTGAAAASAARSSVKCGFMGVWRRESITLCLLRNRGCECVSTFA
jgi:uncharacterized membrane protein